MNINVQNNFHKTTVRIYYADTDCGKVIYYGNYMRYFEIGRTEYMRDLGIELEEFHNQGILFVVVRVEVEYKYSGKYNDILTIMSKLDEFTKKTFTIYNEIYNQKNILLVKGLTKCACVTEQGKLANLPEKIIEIFKQLPVKKYAQQNL